MQLLRHVVVLILIFLLGFAVADDIVWQQQENSALPEGVLLFKGTQSTPKLQAYYLDVDLNNPDLAIRPYIGSPKIVPSFTQNVGAYAAVNGGFFGGSTSYSSAIYPQEVKAVNVQSVTRNGKSYPLMRSLFSIDTSGAMSVDWIYHFDSSSEGLYRFDQPMDYDFNDATPKSAPQKQNGQVYEDVLVGIGGAPTLVKNGRVQVTYNEEIMWGSGVGYDNGDPRTAVGYTADNHVILFVADGRQGAISEGLGLPELAQVLVNLGCEEAMNLDGGGSTQMAVPGAYINTPSENRAVPTILAVVHKDSLGLPQTPLIEKIIDTGDAQCELIGEGWFPTANQGFWGETSSMLNGKGDGSAIASFKTGLTKKAKYEVYAWWVAASNRCTDTPVIIKHADGRDTVRVNQTQNGSTWVPVGKYTFSGDTSESVIISDAATGGTYVVADAIRLVSYDTSGVVSITNQKPKMAVQMDLKQNYPNPFNPRTLIRYELYSRGNVELSVYNTLGQKITVLVNGQQNAGEHADYFDGRNLASGIYYYQLKSGGQVQTKKMLLIQ